MTKQLAYSGALEVTQIRAAGLHVRRPLKHFYTYYKVCADDLVALRAGTITKRCQLLMQQLKVPADSYRVGKTIIFLASHSMMDDLDKLREVTHPDRHPPLARRARTHMHMHMHSL